MFAPASTSIATASPFPHFSSSFRTVSSYLNTVISAGFALARIEEPVPSPDVCDSSARFDRWQRHAALILLVLARRPAG